MSLRLLNAARPALRRDTDRRASPTPLVAPDATGFGPVLEAKLLDALLLIGLHVLLQSPSLLQGPRDRYM